MHGYQNLNLDILIDALRNRLSDLLEFVDKGQQHYEEQQFERSVAALKRRATALGFVIAPVTART